MENFLLEECFIVFVCVYSVLWGVCLYSGVWVKNASECVNELNNRVEIFESE